MSSRTSRVDAAGSVVPPQDTYLGMPPFPTAAKHQLRNSQQRSNLTHATRTIRGKRNALVADKDDWEQLRSAGAAIKDEVLTHLDEYLVQFEEAATAAGATVHWAPDASAANRIVGEIAVAAGVSDVVKAKSMATEEIGLVEALAAADVNAYETDLAALIVQLSADVPSHIVVPAIHRNRAEIREIFTTNMGTFGEPAPADLDDDPTHLAAAARHHLRQKFLAAEMAVTGANFAVAESGSLLLVESEGNGRMCVTMPKTLVSVVGIEKLVPTWRDVEVYLQLLARSATGEPMNPYTSVWTGAHADDGPTDVHIVLLDNNRTDILADEVGRQTLRCIRCAACLNVCPVYERAGGHSYGSVYPGPIGAILSPQLRGLHDDVDRELPYASSLCGACFEACPMEINIPRVLVQLRADVIDEEPALKPSAERAAMSVAAAGFSHRTLFDIGEKAAGFAHRLIRNERGITSVPGFSGWFSTRDIATPPAESFSSWWARTGGADDE